MKDRNQKSKKGQSKSGKPLEKADTLFIDKHERDTFLPLLRYLYGIEFQDKIEFVSSLSLTSRKCLIFDNEGVKYFLKRKPEYSLQEPLRTRAIRLQSLLATKVPFIPQIIFTKTDNQPLGVINSSHYLLTKYVDGQIFGGRIEQSITGASKLGLMHKIANQNLAEESSPVDSNESVKTFIGYAEKMSFSDAKLQNEVLDKIRKKVQTLKSENKGKMSWIHSDFAPFNLVFSGDEVVAVNDFDNATFGNISKDVAECIISFADINYNGATSFLNKVIRTSIDERSMARLLEAYMNTSESSISDLTDLPNEMSLMWLKLMVLGLLRGDFALEDVNVVLNHADDLNVVGNELLHSLK